MLKNTTIQSQQRTYYKRGPSNMQKQSQSRRYEEEDIRAQSKSPYIKVLFYLYREKCRAELLHLIDLLIKLNQAI
jgi:hypothetical protein